MNRLFDFFNNVTNAVVTSICPGNQNVNIVKTRTAWAVFKYCGTKTVPLRMKK
jgi:hypothetical protein